MPSSARRGAGIEAWVITAGWLTRLSTPPSDSARVSVGVESLEDLKADLEHALA